MIALKKAKVICISDKTVIAMPSPKYQINISTEWSLLP